MAIVVAGLTSSSFAADSFVGAFKEGKVSGTLKSFYRDLSSAQDTTGFAVGGELGYVTDSLNGFNAGVTFQTSHTLGMQEENPLEVDKSIATSKTTLSEAYVSYTVDEAKTVIKVGRQYFDTPLASSVSSRMFNDSYQSLAIINTYFANTVLVAASVDKFQSRFSEFAAIDEIFPNTGKYIHTVYANNKSIAGLDLTAQATFHTDERNLLYVNAAYDLATSFPLTIGAQYIGDYADTSGEADSCIYGLMLETKVAGIGFGAYYNSTDEDGDVFTGYGQGTDLTYNSVQYLTGTTAGTDSYQAKVSYDFKQVGMSGLSAFARYTVYDNAVVATNDATEYNLDVSYKFSSAAKGLDLRVRYANVDYDEAAQDNVKDFRIIANYKF